MQNDLSPNIPRNGYSIRIFYCSACGPIFRQTDYLFIMFLFLRHKDIYIMQRNLVSLPHY